MSARDGVALARRALRRLVVGLLRHQGAARGGEVPAARGRVRGGRPPVLGGPEPRGAGGGEKGAAQDVLAEGVQARPGQTRDAGARGGRVPARERLLRGHGFGFPRPSVRVQGQEQGVEGQAGRGQGAGEPDRDPGSQRHGHALRLAAARAQVYLELVLRVRHAQGRALVLDGDGGRRDVHRREDHSDGQEAGGRHREAPGAGYGRNLVLSARLFPRGVFPDADDGVGV